jgi:hypothetical protein
MYQTHEAIREALGSISPALLKKNWDENRGDIIRYLKWRGVFITKEHLIPKTQLKKCIELLAAHTKYRMMDLSDLSDLIE